MVLRIILLIIISYVGQVVCLEASPGQKLNPSQRQMEEIADAFEKAYFDYSPEVGLWLGKSDVALDRFKDYSQNANRVWEREEDRFLAEINKVDHSALVDSPQYITYALLKETLEGNRALRICRDELWDVSSLTGWHIMLAALAEKQPVGTPVLRAHALKRWEGFNKVVDQQIENLKIGIKEGYTAPKPVVRRVLDQIKILVDTPVEDSPYFDFARRDPDPVFKNRVAKIVAEKINPALKKYARYLEEEYWPRARDKIGISVLPQGEQCYKAKLLHHTTLVVPPEEIQAYGYAHMQQLSQEVATIGQQEYGVQEMSVVFASVKHDPKHFFHSEQELLEYNVKAQARAEQKILAWFTKMPEAKGVLKPYPLHRAQTGASGEYHHPSEDGTRPGIFYINTYQPEKRSRMDHEATLFHELIPGHHFQIALAYEDKSRHSINKYYSNSGYAEGWALYVERLADEMGLYKDDISRLGMLSNEALRTARLVVDPGIHVMNWTREQAIAYMKKHTAMNEDIIEAEVDRYIIYPGQATAYMLGKREIETLREKAKVALGDQFDIREFHWQILKNGSVTLPMLKEQVVAWQNTLLAGKAQKT